MELVISQPLKKFRPSLDTRMYIAVFTRTQALDTVWPFVKFCFYGASLTPRTALEQEELHCVSCPILLIQYSYRCHPYLEAVCPVLGLRTHHVVVAGDKFKSDAARSHKQHECIHEPCLLCKHRKPIFLHKTLWSPLFNLCGTVYHIRKWRDVPTWCNNYDILS